MIGIVKFKRIADIILLASSEHNALCVVEPEVH